jgi:endonuclease/exonuclease/phosphatase family metal-dependent hydrolase
MYKKLLLLIIIFIVTFTSSCNSGNITNEFTCNENQTLINNQCLDNSLICGNLICEDHQICEMNECKSTLVFSTFNLYDLKNNNAYYNLAKFINDFDIDIMVSQEIQPEDKEEIINALNELGINVYIEFSSYGGYGGDDGDDYLAVISKWPPKEVNTILDETYQDPITQNSYTFNYMRPILEIKVDFNGKEITIFNIHLKAQSPYLTCTDCIEKRRAQAFALENYIKENYDAKNDNIIIAGDANTATETDEDFQEGNTLDILTLKSDNPENIENDFLSINYTYKKEMTHTIYDSIMDHIILSPSMIKKYIENSIDIITPTGTPSDHKALLLKIKL